MPGMRTLADMRCTTCRSEFYGDLPAGHGWSYPKLLDKANGRVFGDRKASWFANWLEASYVGRTNEPIKIDYQEFRQAEQWIVLNCLDTLYGHSLLKLINAQYYLDHHPGKGLLLIIPSFLRWMVPDGVAAVWTVDLSLSRGIEWNDWLAQEFSNHISKQYPESWLSLAHSHPHPDDYTIERFTRVKPYAVERTLCTARPKITFIWREDRLWSKFPLSKQILPTKFRKGWEHCLLLQMQNKKITALAQALLQRFPELDFAVAGLGLSTHFPSWIQDLRVDQIDTSIEKNWCQRYADSQIVIGVHGSNMLLPSAHAGAVVELVPEDRWGNVIQDLLIASSDARDSIYRYRLLPLSSQVKDAVRIVAFMLQGDHTYFMKMRR